LLPTPCDPFDENDEECQPSLPSKPSRLSSTAIPFTARESFNILNECKTVAHEILRQIDSLHGQPTPLLGVLSHLKSGLSHIDACKRMDPSSFGALKTIAVNPPRFKSDEKKKSTRQKDMLEVKRSIPRNKKRKRTVTNPQTFHEFKELEREKAANDEDDEVYTVDSLTGKRRIVYPKIAREVLYGTAVECEYETRFLKCGTLEWVTNDNLLGKELEAERNRIDAMYTKNAFGRESFDLQVNHVNRPKSKAKLINGKFFVHYPLEKTRKKCVIVQYNPNRKCPFIVVFEDLDILACNIDMIKTQVHQACA
jgi:hypothetical protein